jgi:hypothetical protein
LTFYGFTGIENSSEFRFVNSPIPVPTSVSLVDEEGSKFLYVTREEAPQCFIVHAKFAYAFRSHKISCMRCEELVGSSRGVKSKHKDCSLSKNTKCIVKDAKEEFERRWIARNPGNDSIVVTGGGVSSLAVSRALSDLSSQGITLPAMFISLGTHPACESMFEVEKNPQSCGSHMKRAWEIHSRAPDIPVPSRKPYKDEKLLAGTRLVWVRNKKSLTNVFLGDTNHLTWLCRIKLCYFHVQLTVVYIFIAVVL